MFFFSDLLYEHYIPNNPDKQDSILRKLSEYCGKSMFNYTTEDAEPPYKWDFYHSFFFSYTVVSTIGKILLKKKITSHCIPHITPATQRKPGNLVLSYSIPIKTLAFPILHQILKALHVEWR